MTDFLPEPGVDLVMLPRRLPSALVVSAVTHVGVLAIVALVVARGIVAPHGDAAPRRADAAAPAVARMVFLPSAGAGGGGGGGGNRHAEPIRRAEAIGRDRVTLRIAKPAPLAAPAAVVDAVPALPSLVLDAVPLASGTRDLIGLPTGGVSEGVSTGPGSGGGVGTGTGTGIGSGAGPGLGEGRGGGAGGDVYRPGGSVSAPRLVTQVRPTYTADAMQRRVQGSVVIEMVVMPNGSPARIRVVRSLDPDLDDRAMAAVAQWRFEPGRLSGRPVSVLVNVVLDFTIH
ncbi:MAG TPA: energy transducer TonB [Vicinamibacterales bacterium]|nr:energy transducer TonB [Vicinamibacterales bacterium]